MEGITPAGGTGGVTPSGGGILGKEAALAVAVALGLLGGMGIAYTKALDAGNVAQKALIQFIRDMQKLLEDRSKNADKATINKDWAQIKKDLQNVLPGLMDPNASYMKGFKKGTDDVKNGISKFLKDILNKLADIFSQMPDDKKVKGNKSPFYNAGGLIAKFLRDIADGKKPDIDWKKVDADFGSWRDNSALWPDNPNDMIPKLNNILQEAQGQWSQWSVQAKFVTQMANKWYEVAQKAVDTLRKTLDIMLPKF